MESKNALLKNIQETSIESNTMNGNKPASPADSSTWSSPSLVEESFLRNSQRNEPEIIVNRRSENVTNDDTSSSTTDLYLTPRLSPNTVLISPTLSTLPI